MLLHLSIPEPHVGEAAPPGAPEQNGETSPTKIAIGLRRILCGSLHHSSAEDNSEILPAPRAGQNAKYTYCNGKEQHRY